VNNGDNYNPRSKRAAKPQVTTQPAPDECAQGPTPFGTRFLDPAKLPPVVNQSVIRPIEPPPASALSAPITNVS
jgi:hypothetical protein